MAYKVKMTKQQLNQLKGIKRVFDGDCTGMMHDCRGQSFGDPEMSMFENFVEGYVREFGNDELCLAAYENEDVIKQAWCF